MKSSVNLLIVEDISGDAKLLSLALHQMPNLSSHLYFAKTIKEALKLLEEKSIDLVFLDLNLPDSRGSDSINKIHQAHPTKPILIMTGTDHFELVNKSLSLGADGYLVKDNIPPASLERRIATAIVKKKSEQELIQKSGSKSSYLANLSHEIRNPLNSIIGLANLLIEENPRPEQRKYLEVLKRAGNTLLELINQVLDLSKIEAGKMELQIVPCDLTSVAQTAIDLMMLKANEKKIELKFKQDKKIPKSIKTDPVRLRQILVNLLSNAVKFTEIGSVILEIKISPQKEKTLLFSVLDTGPGISEEILPKLFQNYYQEDIATYEKFGGTGLGLAISKSLVDLLQGKIWAESKINQGSTFFFEILYENIDEIQTEKPKIDSNQSLIPLRVLIAEDSPENQFVIKAVLKNTPFILEFCDNGKEAVKLVKENKYDVLLMDMQMPILDGYMATSQIRDWENENHMDKKIPIIALTANALSHDCAKTKNAGCDAHISKPFGKDFLINTIVKLAQLKK